MIKFEGKIIDPVGIHARPAALLSNTASKFQSSIDLAFNGKKANMKSIMGIMTLGITCGSEIAVEIDGADENEALETITEVLKSNNIAE